MKNACGAMLIFFGLAQACAVDAQQMVYVVRHGEKLDESKDTPPTRRACSRKSPPTAPTTRCWWWATAIPCR